MMESQSEHIVSNKPGLTQGLQHKGLREPVGRIVISLSNITVNSLISLSKCPTTVWTAV